MTVLIKDLVFEMGKLHGKEKQAEIKLACAVETLAQGRECVADIVLRLHEIREGISHHVAHSVHATQAVIVACRDNGVHLRIVDDEKIKDMAPDILLGVVAVGITLFQEILIHARILDCIGNGAHEIVEGKIMHPVTRRQRAQLLVAVDTLDKPCVGERLIASAFHYIVCYTLHQHEHVEIEGIGETLFFRRIGRGTLERELLFHQQIGI